MQITPTQYIIGIFFVHGFFTEDEVDLQWIFYRNTETSPWEIEFRSRRYKDNKDYAETEDEKKYYDIKLRPEELFTSEEKIIEKAHTLGALLSSSLTDGYYDYILIRDLGERFPEHLMAANKPWIKIKKVPIDSEEGKAIKDKLDKNSNNS